jgi:hypothetical protein
MSPDLECDFSGDVNVKQMDLAVESHQLSCCSVNGIDQTTDGCVRTLGRIHCGSVVEIARGCLSLGYRSCFLDSDLLQLCRESEVNVPPTSQVPVSLATDESILTVSLSLLAGS